MPGVRNPMVTGVFILLAGLGVLLRSISLVFIFTPLFILLNVLQLKAMEEPELERHLGKEYVEYKKRVPMFIPLLKVKTKGDSQNKRRRTAHYPCLQSITTRSPNSTFKREAADPFLTDTSSVSLEPVIRNSKSSGARA